jgi:hypothetical protein
MLIMLQASWYIVNWINTMSSPNEKAFSQVPPLAVPSTAMRKSR